MNRKYTREIYLEKINKLKTFVPSLSLTTDIIVGFPGESYEEFCDTKKVIKEVGYYNIFSFVYSKRKGTKAAEMEDNISDKQKGLWLRELLLEQRETAMVPNNYTRVDDPDTLKKLALLFDNLEEDDDVDEF